MVRPQHISPSQYCLIYHSGSQGCGTNGRHAIFWRIWRWNCQRQGWRWWDVCCDTDIWESSGRGIAIRWKELFYLFVGKKTCLVNPINGFATLNIHLAIVYDIHKILLVIDFLLNQIDGDSDILVIFWIIKRYPQIVIFYFHSHETGSCYVNCALQ